MSKTARTDGQMQVDCDINGVPICIGRPLSLPRYDVLTIDECRLGRGKWVTLGEEADWTLDCRDWVKVEVQR